MRGVPHTTRIILSLLLIILLSSCKKDPPKEIPSLTTAISDLASTSITAIGNISSDGGAEILSKGFCWDTSSNPTTNSQKTINGVGIGSFTTTITGLLPGTTYYLRSYAVNTVGTGYGNLVTFTTPAVVPVINTTQATSITSSTATCGGNISSDGGSPITVRGVCWDTKESPIAALNAKTEDGAGTGSFTSSITGLSPGTTYYIRAYATNSVGTSYGNQITINTIAILPVITTTEATSVTSTTAYSGGDITSDGGATVTARGVCWSTAPNPTTANSKTTDGAGSGSFTSSITGLSPGTTYYIRAYATNSVGTSYGNQITISTLAVLPAITTTEATSVTSTTAYSGGDITSDGGATVTARGVCWSTAPNPTTANSKTTDGGGSGSFTSSITGLSPGTTYYIRAYATNSVGTSYGNQVVINTRNSSEIVIVGTSSNIQHLNLSGDFIFQLNNLTNNSVYFVFTNTNTSTSITLPVVTGSNVSSQVFSNYSQTFYPSFNTPEERGISEFNNNPGRYAYRGVYSPNLMQTVITKSGGYALGSKENFIDYYTSNPLPSTVRKLINAKGKNLYVWVADDCWGPTSNKAKYVTQQMVDELSVKFLNSGTNSDIYEWVTNIIGSPWENTGYSNLIPGTDDIHILLCDIKNDNSTNGGIIGYFYGGNNYLKSSVSNSNEKLMFVMDAVLLATPEGGSWEISDYWPQTIVSGLAHELQHMIHFYQKAVKFNISTNVAINEMASMCIEDLVANKIMANGPRGVAYGRANAGTSMNTQGRLPGYNIKNYYNLLDWSSNESETYLNYSKTYALGAYLMRNYGGANFIKRLVKSSYVGINNIVDAVNQNGGDGLTYKEILMNFGVANLLSDKTNLTTGYIYNTGTWFTSNVDGITYQIGSINLYNYNPTPYIFTTLPTSQRAGSNLFYLSGSGLSGTKEWAIKGLSSEIKISVIIK